MQKIIVNPDNVDPKELEPAAKILMDGGVIAYPTETVYGLGANVYCEAAVLRIFKIKSRDTNKPISIMIGRIDEVNKYVRFIPESGRRIMLRFWPGPVTLVFQASDEVPKYLIGTSGKIGIRMPNHAVTKALMASHPEPVTTTSANLSGQKDSIDAQTVEELFADRIDLIIDGGTSTRNVPSTVVDVSGQTPVILREGQVSADEINDALGGSE